MKKLLILFVMALFLTACGTSANNLSTNDAVTAFKDAGLKAENPREMTKDDYGIAPMLAKEAQIVQIGDDINARIFSFDKEEDLDTTKAVYDELGKGSAWLFSWTIKHKNILVQMGGDLKEEEFNKYKAALEAL